jgi:hypothetical protein
MYKAKLCSFAIACMVGLVGISPMTTFAAETNTESATLSETDKDQKDKKAAFEEKMIQASEKWDSLTMKQKEEVYSLLENEMKAEIKLMNKLVTLGVMQKEDVEVFKAHMLETFSKVKESGEFPLLRQKCKKSGK